MNNEDKQFFKELVEGAEERIMASTANGFAEVHKKLAEAQKERTEAKEHREELSKRIQNRHLEATDKFATKEKLDEVKDQVFRLENA